MRFGKGDKVVIEIKDVVRDLNGPVYVTGNNSLGEVVPLDEIAEPLSKYEEPLKAKLKIQEHNIIELLKENAQLRADYNALSESLDGFKKRVDDMCEVDNGRGRIKGQHEAWELAQKVYLLPESGGYNSNELIEIFGTASTGEILKYTYAEAATKVAEWEKAKEEICVGDVVECEEHCGVVVGVGEVYVKGFTSDWTPFQWMKQSCTKTGRHIDVNTWLAQIGENNE